MASLVERLQFILENFDVVDKVRLAEQLVKTLELEEGEPATGKVRAALSRRLGSEEVFRIEVLEKIAIDYDYFRSADAFPDSIGAPKSGL